MNSFTYSADKINKMIDDNGYKPVVMTGIRDNLLDLKPIIENLYDDKIFYLNYWQSECAWHGWDWSKDDGTIANMVDMANITIGITDKFLEIYAMILGGLGERCEKENDD